MVEGCVVPWWMLSSLVLVMWNPGFLGLNSQFFVVCVLLIHKGVRVTSFVPLCNLSYSGDLLLSPKDLWDKGSS